MMAYPSLRPRRVYLASDCRGAVLTEFGLLAPVMLLLLVGAFDVGHSLYLKTIIEGAVQKAARDSGLESGTLADSQDDIDTQVRAQLRPLIGNAPAINITRTYFRNFADADAGTAEPFTDSDGDDICDLGEPYEDRNNSGSWDSTGGATGQGQAQDAVIYRVSIAYPRMFPLHRFIGLPATSTVSAETVMNNQPYGSQAAVTPDNCPATDLS
jgi:Flp pilus assembly protein TadG